MWNAIDKSGRRRIAFPKRRWVNQEVTVITSTVMSHTGSDTELYDTEVLEPVAKRHESEHESTSDAGEFGFFN